MDGSMRNRIICIVLTAVSMALVTGPAFSKAPPLDPLKFDVRLRGVPFGKNLRAFLSYAKESTQGLYHQRIQQTPERNERDQLRLEAAERVQRIQESHIAFAGQNTGYNVSVVAGDFAHNSGESMIIAKTGRLQDYFFFQGGRLWKLVTSDPNVREFSSLLVKLTTIYGPPSIVQYADPKNRHSPYKAVWNSDDIRLEAESRPDFGTVTLRWAQQTIASSIQDSRGPNRPPADRGEATLDPDILDIMKD